MFSFWKSSKGTKKVLSKGGARGRSAEGSILRLIVGSLSWQAVLSPKGKPDQTFGGEMLLWAERGEERTDRALKMALEAIGTAEMKKVGRISLTIDDPDMVFADTKPEPLRRPSPAAARKHGARLVNGREVTFGYARFDSLANEDLAAMEERDGQRGVYAFSDAEFLRRRISSLGGYADKLTEVIPLPSILFSRAIDSVDALYGGLSIGAEHSWLLLCNRDEGALTLRLLPIGFESVIASVAEALGVDGAQARDALSRRSMVDEVGSAGDSPLAAGLQPSLQRLVDELENSYEFFDTQRACGRPERLELIGNGEPILGFYDWLAARLTPRLERVEESVAELCCGCPRCKEMNFFVGENQDRPLVTVGRMHFVYSEEKGKLVPKRRPGAGSAAVVAPGNRKAGHPGPRGRRRKEPSNPTWSLWTRLLSRYQSDVGGDRPEDPGQNDRKYVAMAVALFSVLILFSYDSYSGLERKYQGSASRYGKLLSDYDEVRAKVRKNDGFLRVGPENVDKVLWTEKFLSLASNMDQSLWLTDVYLSNEQRSVGDEQLKTQKLTIEGAALPSTEGHIARVSEYVRNLMDDEEHFMDDFRDIRFDGAYLDANESDQIVRFTLEAWYDESVRVETAKRKAMVGGGAIDKMQQSVDERDEALSKTLPQGVKP